MAEPKDTMISCTIVTFTYFKLDRVYIDLQTLMDLESGKIDNGFLKITNTKRTKLIKIGSIVDIYYDENSKDQMSVQDLEEKTKSFVEEGKIPLYFFHTRRIKHVV